jgi:hypothetical protein
VEVFTPHGELTSKVSILASNRHIKHHQALVKIQVVVPVLLPIWKPLFRL